MSAWQPDTLLPGFEALELEFPPDYDGAVCATLVRLPGGEAPRGAVLYVHGFIDYFFQRHMAERFALEGYAFYALDLRKHGRSLRPHQHANFCKDIAEYYADITRAIDEIGAPVLLAGHSTGGLVCSLYAHEGARRDAVRALWLNSPFFDWKLPDLKRAAAAPRRRARPLLPVPQEPGRAAARSTRRRCSSTGSSTRGSSRSRASRSTSAGSAPSTTRTPRCTAASRIGCPVLSMHSDEADMVLDWRHIARWSRGLGPQVAVLAFPGGVHDLVLSRPEIREEVFRQLFAWAERVSG